MVHGLENVGWVRVILTLNIRMLNWIFHSGWSWLAIYLVCFNQMISQIPFTVFSVDLSWKGWPVSHLHYRLCLHCEFGPLEPREGAPLGLFVGGVPAPRTNPALEEYCWVSLANLSSCWFLACTLSFLFHSIPGIWPKNCPQTPLRSWHRPVHFRKFKLTGTPAFCYRPSGLV